MLLHEKAVKVAYLSLSNTLSMEVSMFETYMEMGSKLSMRGVEKGCGVKRPPVVWNVIVRAVLSQGLKPDLVCSYLWHWTWQWAQNPRIIWFIRNLKGHLVPITSREHCPSPGCVSSPDGLGKLYFVSSGLKYFDLLTKHVAAAAHWAVYVGRVRF